jgi:phage shock protein PspC (stress-responsive transcriptional regulator)
MGERLYRSRADRMVAGVAGGLAEIWDIDPSLLRILWAVLIVFTGGIALLVYIVMAIVVPDEYDLYPPDPATVAAAAAMVPSDPAAAQARAEARAARRASREARGGRTSAGLIVGGFLVLLGTFFLIREFLPSIDFDWFWPLVLVGLGILLVVVALGRGPSSSARP